MYKLLILACFVAATQAQQLFLGRCPDVQLQENFDVAKYMGKWYEMERYFASFELFSSCVTADYSLDGDRVIVNNTGRYPILGYYTVVGDAIQPDQNNPAKLAVSFAESPTPESRGDYWVVSTDYESYTIVWSCSQIYFWNTQFAWVLTRDRAGLSDETMQTVYQKLDEAQISKTQFRSTTQTDC